MSVFKIENLCYSYSDSDKQVLKNINYEFEKGNVYAITGKSGTGKTTLLSLMSGLDKPTSGKILYNGSDISKINENKYRSNHVGVIFQSLNLLQHLTALENVVLSIDIAGIKVEDKRQHALDMLAKVGINEEKANRKVLRLSGGEQQRVAIARTLAFNPDVILADEPSGNLDHVNEEQVLDIFRDLAKKEDKCVIIVTHSKNVSDNVDVVYNLEEYKRK